MLGKAAVRFIRTKWRSVQDFAEECYALFNDKLPLSHSGPITLTPEPGTTAITIITDGDDTVPPITVNGLPIGTSGGGGGTDLSDIDWPDLPPGDEADAIPSPADNPIALWGRVVAKLSGDTYAVRCWAKNPDTSPAIGVLTVQQGLIDADDEIPPLTPVMVLAFPSSGAIAKAVMQVPVWLEATT